MKVKYWLEDKNEQNFGDALTRFFLEEVFLGTTIEAAAYRIIGSSIADFIVEDDLGPVGSPDDARRLIFWGAGLRDAKSLSSQAKTRCLFASVRGPLTHKALGLDATVPIGDPALLLKALHQPSPFNRFGPRTICIPHFHDRRHDKELLEISGAQGIVRPNILPGLASVKKIIDEIYAADFILSASLHGAIVAASYGKPFCFWNPDYVDLPFKWQDFAASIGINASFARTIDEGRHIYDTKIASFIKLPKLLPVLMAAPFSARPDMFLKVLSEDHTDILDRGRLEKLLELTGPQKQTSSFSEFYDKLDKALRLNEPGKNQHAVVNLASHSGPHETRAKSRPRRIESRGGFADPQIGDLLKSVTAEREAIRAKIEALKTKFDR